MVKPLGYASHIENGSPDCSGTTQCSSPWFVVFTGQTSWIQWLQDEVLYLTPFAELVGGVRGLEGRA